MSGMFLLESFANDATNFAQEQVAQVIPLPPEFIIVGIVLIIVTILIIFFMKRIIVNSVLGLVVWGLANYLFNLGLPFWPSLVVSVIFGPAGTGVMIVLKVFGFF